MKYRSDAGWSDRSVCVVGQSARLGLDRRGRPSGRPGENGLKRIGLLVALVAAWTLPALAQTDVVSGMWRPLSRNEDGSGMDGDYAGLPLSAAGRLRAQSWAPENFDVPEMVCRPALVGLLD